jgi:hypothetical protein
VLVGTLALVIPLIGQNEDPAMATVIAVGPFLLVTLFALTVRSQNALFELFARPGDRRHGKLYGLAGFALTAAGLAILTIEFGMPNHVYVGTIFVLTIGNLSGHLVRTMTHERVVAAGGFVLGGFLAGTLGQLLTIELAGMGLPWQTVAFLGASGSLIAALLRETFFKHDDALILVTIALMLWLIAGFPLAISTQRIAVALVVTIVLGYASFALDTASLPGMITGVLLGLLTIVLGDYGWFAMLIAFFGTNESWNEGSHRKTRGHGAPGTSSQTRLWRWSQCLRPPAHRAASPKQPSSLPLPEPSALLSPIRSPVKSVGSTTIRG